ncbi:MAG: hypothetical protein HY335_05280 [Deinococcus sp.]|nr:hypothetical protein [Deinococcus sp.]
MSEAKDLLHTVAERIARDLDPVQLQLRVQSLRDQRPGASNDQLAEAITGWYSFQATAFGTAATLPALLPGIGTALALASLPIELYLQARLLTALEMELAILYGQKPTAVDVERSAQHVLEGLTVGAVAAGSGLLGPGLFPRLLRPLLGRELARLAPLLAPVLTAATAYRSVQATAKTARERYQPQTPPAEPVQVPVE